MSIEQAINEHASAIRELAAAIRSTIGGVAGALHVVAAASVEELEAAVTKVETDAKVEQKKVMEQVAADRKPSTAKEAVDDALAKAKAEKEAAAAPVVEEDDPLADSAPVELDYDKDVKKKLVAVGKHKQEMVDLLKGFGVGAGLKYEKADKLPKEMYADVVAACDKILAARG